MYKISTDIVSAADQLVLLPQQVCLLARKGQQAAAVNAYLVATTAAVVNNNQGGAVYRGRMASYAWDKVPVGETPGDQSTGVRIVPLYGWYSGLTSTCVHVGLESSQVAGAQLRDIASKMETATPLIQAVSCTRIDQAFGPGVFVNKTPEADKELAGCPVVVKYLPGDSTPREMYLTPMPLLLGESCEVMPELRTAPYEAMGKWEEWARRLSAACNSPLFVGHKADGHALAVDPWEKVTCAEYAQVTTQLGLSPRVVLSDDNPASLKQSDLLNGLDQPKRDWTLGGFLPSGVPTPSTWGIPT